ncbi:MAG: hypothetical protein ACRD3W_22560, partial [Terriglobales bacterium]
LLCGMLSSQEHIICCGELFNVHRIQYQRMGAAPNDDGTQASLISTHVDRGIRFRNKYPLKFLRRFWSFPASQKALGFKISTAQFPAVVQLLVDDRSVKKIMLRRRNKLKQYLSFHIADSTGRWIKNDDTPHEQVKVRSSDISVDEIRQFLRLREEPYEKAKSQLIDQSQAFFEIAYEDLVGARRSSLLDELGAFLNCPTVDRQAWMQDPLKKTNVDELPELIEDYDGLVKKLRGTEFEQFLEQ